VIYWYKPKKEVRDMDFTEKIRFVREKLNMSQEDLALALNVSYVSLNLP